MTRGYRGLQRVTRGYRGLQGVTGGYKGLQGVTGGDKGLQGVTRDNRGLQGVTGGYKTTSEQILSSNRVCEYHGILHEKLLFPLFTIRSRNQ